MLDFDFTVIDVNSDTFVVEKLSTETAQAMQRLKEASKENQVISPYAPARLFPALTWWVLLPVDCGHGPRNGTSAHDLRMESPALTERVVLPGMFASARGVNRSN